MKNQDLSFVDTLYAQSNAQVKKYVYILFSSIILLFLIFLIWAKVSLIDELARGQGKVIPSSKIQTIQSLDGGIISEILVKEGSIVKSGDFLMKIDTTRFKASLDENKDKLKNLIATKVRLEQESTIDPYSKIKILDYNNYNLEEYKKVVRGQNNLFTNNINELKANISTLDIQIQQKQQELIELKSKIRQLLKTLRLIKEEKNTIASLVKKRARSNIDLISIKKEYQKAIGDYNSAKLSIPRLKLSISETQHKILEKIATFKAKASGELEKINSEIKLYKSKVISEKDKLDKTIIISPVDGIVKQININTIGGVVRSGVDLIEIVPQSKIMLVEAKIKPKDIAFINPNQKAIVKITAYDFSIYGGLEGKIVEISADSIKDKDSKDGQTYYKVVIQTNKNYLEKDGNKFSIIPGMIASVDIITGQKSILDFILKPILKTKNSAFHER